MFDRMFAACAVLAAAVTLTACGGNDSNEGSASSGKTGGADDVQAVAQEKIKEFMTLPEKFPGGTTPYNPGTGKAGALVTGFGAAPSVDAARWAVDAFHAMGWQSGPPVDGKFSPTVQAAFMDRAVQDKLDGVVLVGVDVNNLAASVERAAAAGVRITCIVCTSGEKWKGKVVDVTPDWLKTGQIAAWRTLANSGSDDKVVTFHAEEFAAVRLRTKGVTDTIKQNCEKCTLDVVKMTAGDLSKPGPPQWVAYLASHPEGTVNNVIGMYDDQSMIITRTALQSGREFLVGGYDGSVPNLTAMSEGKPPIDFSVAHPFHYEAWAAADAIARWTAGEPVPDDLDNMPNLLVTKDNVQELLGGPEGDYYPTPKGDWQGEFKKLWGKS